MTIILFLSLNFLTPALAIQEGTTVKRPSYQKQTIEYSRQFLLDSQTFAARSVDRLNLDRWFSNDYYGGGTEYSLERTTTREGLVLRLSAKGDAQAVEQLFTVLLDNVVSVIHTKGGWIWSLPSEEYKNHWNLLAVDTKRDIRRVAIDRSMDAF